MIVFLNGASQFAFNNTFHPLIAFDIEEPRRRFVGRSKELKELNVALTCENERLWLVVGPGGMGKSQLMKKFLSQIRNEYNSVWLRGESKHSLLTSVKLIFKQLGCSSQDAKGIPLSQLMHDIVKQNHKSSSGRPCVFVIDNVDETHPVAEAGVTALIALSTVKTFVTSRLRNSLGGTCEMVEVKPLSGEDAQLYVTDSLRLHENDGFQIYVNDSLSLHEDDGTALTLCTT
jgi:hypothetical protein